MSENGTVHLMYHEMYLPGRELCQNSSGYVRYVVRQSDFLSQLSRLSEIGFYGSSVGDAMQNLNQSRRRIVVTFDDGCETDLIAAAPALRDAKFNATFYLVVGWLGRRGFLSHTQVRELCDMGFEVGCHSMSHALLNDIEPDHLHVEIVEAKDRLEQIIGRRVNHFSCPGGRWTRTVARIARESGYHSVTTSRVATNAPNTNPYCLGRIAVLRRTSLNEYDRLCRGKGLWVRRARFQILSVGKRLLGNSVYGQVRNALLER